MKHKKCCGSHQRPLPPGLAEAIELSVRHHDAAEQVRTRQQGFGRGIIHVDHPRGRVVAVGSEIYTSTQWQFFTDFLIHFIRTKIGPVGDSHPIKMWFSQLMATPSLVEGGPRSAAYAGHVASFLYLAYSLYLLQHHDQIPQSLLVRLRNPNFFLPAAYEAYVGAAFALSGFSLVAQEVGATDKTQGEFVVRSKRTQKSYSVEAKRRDGWKSRYTSPMSERFVEELRYYVRNRLFKAAKKRLPNPIYWIELSIPGIRTAEEFIAVREEAYAALRHAEGDLKIDGRPIPPAYVFLTNHGHLVSDLTGESGVFAMLEAVRMPTFLTNGPFDLEAAMASYDEHRDVISVIESLNDVQRIPMSFDGTPAELIQASGKSVVPPKIGDRIDFPMNDGVTISGILEEITANGDKAMVVVREDGSNVRKIGSIPLLPEEARAAAVHGDAIFGKDNGGTKLPENDYLALYRWFLDVYAKYSREGLLRAIAKHSRFDELSKLSTAELRVRVARELTKGAAQSAKKHN